MCDVQQRCYVRCNKDVMLGATKMLCQVQQRCYVRCNKDVMLGATKMLATKMLC